MMAANVLIPFSSSGAPAAVPLGGAEVRSTGVPFKPSGSPLCAAQWGNGQIVIARGAKDERLV